MKNGIPVYTICHLSESGQEDILISRFAPYLETHRNLELPHKHTFYHLLLFTEGGGSHAIDFEQFKVRPYQLYFMIPGQVHSWSFEGRVDGYVVNFSIPFFQSFLLKNDYLEQFPFFSGITANSVIDLPEKSRKGVKELFERLAREGEQGQDLVLDMVRALLLQLFILVGRLDPDRGSGKGLPSNHLLLKNFQRLIEKNYLTLRLPREYALQLYVTPNHLNALSNDVLGLSAGELIRNRVLLEAKRLLVNLDLSISEIAYQLNFNDNSYFTKFFKKQTGVTPEDFRKELLKGGKGRKVRLR